MKKRKLQTNIFHKHREILIKMLTNQIDNKYKKELYTTIKQNTFYVCKAVSIFKNQLM